MKRYQILIFALLGAMAMSCDSPNDQLVSLNPPKAYTGESPYTQSEIQGAWNVYRNSAFHPSKSGNGSDLDGLKEYYTDLEERYSGKVATWELLKERLISQMVEKSLLIKGSPEECLKYANALSQNRVNKNSPIEYALWQKASQLVGEEYIRQQYERLQEEAARQS